MAVDMGSVGIAAASGLAQAYVSEKARGASQEELDKLEAMYNNIVPPQYDVKIYDDPKMLAGVPAPAFNVAGITPESYAVVQKYAPQAAAYVKEQAPEVVKASDAGQKGRDAQLEALQKYRDISSEHGFDPSMMDKFNIANQKSQAAAESNTNSILQNAARRGQVGAGSTLAAQLQGGSDAMLRNAQSSSDMAGQAYQAQLEALRQQATLGGNVRSSDISEGKTNADIINSFNQRSSSAYQNYLNQQADLQNKAQLTNINNAQDVANKNVGESNNAQAANLASYNNLQQQQYNNARQQNQDRLGITAAKNKELSQGYNDQLAKANGLGGAYKSQAAAATQTGQDRAKQIQGIADVGANIYNKSQEDDEE